MNAAHDSAALRASLAASFSGRLLTAPDEMAPYLVDYRGRWRGQALAVALPDTAHDVAAVVRWCAAHGHAVVPQGGNTGLTGASVPTEACPTVLLSLKRLTRIRAIDPVGNTMVAEAGCTLAQVQAAATEARRLFPLSLASEGSCTIGGNLATNAGGVQVLAYGNMRELCLGLEAVTADGELWQGLHALRKNNTGYDLRDLLIGSEGTLGVITAAVLKLFAQPVAKVVALVGLGSPSAALKLLSRAQSRLAAGLTAFELISAEAMELVQQHVPGSRLPLTTPCPWYVLLEASSLVSEAEARARLEQVLTDAIDQGLIHDAVLATSLAQSRQFWQLREQISPAQSAEGKNIKHDISVPIARIDAFIEAAEARIRTVFPEARLVVFGHLGDGNLHFNVWPTASPEQVFDAHFETQEAQMNELVHDTVAAFGGAISAEHGIGVLRRQELARYKPAVELQWMRAIKTALDPAGRMNPGKLLPPAWPAGDAPVQTGGRPASGSDCPPASPGTDTSASSGSGSGSGCGMYVDEY
ncbi:MAG: FAD-binding oxidoreductase [Lautropia sp.]|nr:FAD-binding oxidoreductase [Lautropia sp.]